MRLLLWLLLTALLGVAAPLAAQTPVTLSEPAAPGTAAARRVPGTTAERTGERVHEVSLIALLANPRQYDGALVSVTGFLHLEYEGDALYVTKTDFDASLTKNAVWVDGPKFEEMRARKRLSDRYVMVTGRFDADRRGHLGVYAASIEEASRIQIWPTRWQSSIIHRPDFYTLNLPWPLELPWPLIIATLWIWTGLQFLIWRRRGDLRASRRFLLPLAVVTSLFAVARLQGAALGVWAMVAVDAWWSRDVFMMVMAAELITNACGLLLIWVAIRRKLTGLMLAACALTLISPTVVEAMRFDGLTPVHEGVEWSEDMEWVRSRPAPDGSEGYPDRIEF